MGFEVQRRGTARALRLGGVLVALALGTACRSRHLERKDPALPSRTAPADAGVGSARGEAPPACGAPRRAPRTFVGFSDDMSLADFELAAFEAERILHVLQAEPCRIVEAEGSDESLRAALDGERVEITAVYFTRRDAGTADVHLRALRDEDGGVDTGAERRWVLGLVRDNGVWWIASVRAG